MIPKRLPPASFDHSLAPQRPEETQPQTTAVADIIESIQLMVAQSHQHGSYSAQRYYFRLSRALQELDELEPGQADSFVKSVDETLSMLKEKIRPVMGAGWQDRYRERVNAHYPEGEGIQAISFS